MRWRNTVTGLVVDTDETMPYPYERIPGPADDVPVEDLYPVVDKDFNFLTRDPISGRFVKAADESP